MMSRRRMIAVPSLALVAAGVAGFMTLPLTTPRLAHHRTELKHLRAWLRGAEFVTDRGVVLQAHHSDCGAAALKTVLATRGIERSLSDLEIALDTTARGTSLLNLRQTAERAGVPGRSWILNRETLAEVPLPAIALINHDHFVVIRRFVRAGVLEVDDPAFGRLHWPIKSFAHSWSGETLVFDPGWKPQPLARISFAAALRAQTMEGGTDANEEGCMAGFIVGSGGDHCSKRDSGCAVDARVDDSRGSAGARRAVV